MKKQFKSIDEYISAFPKDVQRILEKIRRTIRKAAPEAVEAISYQIPTFRPVSYTHLDVYKRQR